MGRAFYSLFAIAAYAIFFATFLYMIGFVGNLPYLPKTVDSGEGSGLLAAILTNVALISLFGIQHSVMARQGFKRAWTKLIPKPIERSFYVLSASAILLLLFTLWRPMLGNVWHMQSGFGAAVFWALFASGWIIVLLSTFLINHFELFGLQQVYLHARGRDAAAPRFRQPFFYKFVRHPLYSGFFLAFWATPNMSSGHLLLALGMSVYMLIAIQYEERDLVEHFGPDYEAYKQRVGMLAPRFTRRTR